MTQNYAAPASPNAPVPPTDPLHAALHGLVREGTLSPPQAARVGDWFRPLLAAPGAATPAESPTTARGVVVEAAGYLGGALVLSGMAMVVTYNWEALPYAGRLAVAGLTTLLLGAVAVLAGRPWRRTGVSTARSRLASSLSALAAVGAATLAAVLAPDDNESLVASTVGLIVAVAGYAVFRGAPALVASTVAALITVEDVLYQVDASSSVHVTALALVGVVLLLLGMLGALRERGAAGLLGGLVGLGAAQSAAFDSSKVVAVYGLGLGVLFLAGCFGWYLTTRRWPLLVPAVLIALVVPPSVLLTVVENVVVAGAAMAVTGAVVLLGGGVALMWRRPGSATPARHPEWRA